ncbi:YezD family protein [Nitrosomonas ureae]|nr:YezD family protein [Nitrosomonas ureae]
MTQLTTTHKSNQLNTDVIEEILSAVTSIEYGSVEVVIHDGRVVQIECRKKIRLNQSKPNRKTLEP